jgi:hypothetical protein
VVISSQKEEAQLGFSEGLFDIAGASAAREVADLAARRRDLEAALRATAARERGFAAAAESEPETAAHLQLLADQGWTVLHDRRWPGSTRSNVDHLVIGYGGVAVVDTKNWSQSVGVRDNRLWCGDDDRHEEIEKMLALADAIDDLLLEAAESSPGHTLGLSAIHVVPVLAFSRHDHARIPHPRVGRVLLTAAQHLPVLLARRPHVLDAPHVNLISEYLARELPPTVLAAATTAANRRGNIPLRGTPTKSAAPSQAIPRQRSAPVAVPIRAVPAPQPEPPEHSDMGLFDVAELATALARAETRPMRDWMAFLHPTQTRLVKRSFNGPARVRGAAGTGKTVLLLHRAAWLAATRPGRILVTTYVATLPRVYHAIYRDLSPDTADRVDFVSLHQLARNLLADTGNTVRVDPRGIERAFDRAWRSVGATSPLAALRPPKYWRDEIDHVIKGRGLRELAEYEALDRRGRSVPLNDTLKDHVWRLFIAYDRNLDRSGIGDHNDLLATALDAVTQQPPKPGWTAVLVDEVQDLNLLSAKLCRELAHDRPDGLFLVGDGQQSLYPGGFTLPEARISVAGRAVVLRTNYRNTRQIVDAAHQVVAEKAFTDLDTTSEPGLRDIETLREGAPVHIEHAPDEHGIALLLRQRLRRDLADGINPGDMAVLCHTRHHLDTITTYLAGWDVPLCPLAEWDGRPDNRIKIGTIHRSKGLDFSAVYIPDLTRPSSLGTTEHDDRRHHHTQREFVGRTRPRDRLWIATLTSRSNALQNQAIS